MAVTVTLALVIKKERLDEFKGVIKVPEDMVTNCCFGDADLKTLYITAGKTLWKVRMKVAGRLVFPR